MGSVTLRQRAPAGLELAKSGHAVLQLILQGVQGQPAHKHSRLNIVMMSGRRCGCSIGPAVLRPGLQLDTATYPELILAAAQATQVGQLTCCALWPDKERQSCSRGTSSLHQVWTDEEGR